MNPRSASRGKARPPSRRLLYALGLSAIFIAWFFSYGGYLLQQFELKTVDWRFQLRGPRTPGDKVVLVLIDEQSINQIGQWQRWTRSTHARLIRQLHDADAAAIVFDVLFVEPGEPQHDAELVAAAREAGNVVLGAFSPSGGMPTDESQIRLMGRFALNPRAVAHPELALEVPSLRGPIPALAEVTTVGFAMAPPDPDGVFRHAFPVARNQQDGKLYPQLAVAAAQQALGIAGEDISIDFASGMSFGPTTSVRFGHRGRAMVNFAGPTGTRRHYSYVEVLEGRTPAEWLRDKIVLVGMGAGGLYDIHPNPFSPQFLGPEFNADFIENLINNNFLIPVGAGINLLLLIAVGLMVTHLAATRTPITAAGVSAVVLILFVGASVYAFVAGRIVIGVVGPSTAAVLAYGLITLRRLISEERGRSRLRRAFSAYAPPEVVEQLDGGLLQEKMEGIEDEITVLFSDIRNFTAIGSAMEPRQLVAMLNRYFGAMTEVVFDFGGTVDKFIGDGLLVLYNALVEQPDHAKRAVFTALEMRARLERLNEEWQEEGFPEIRIGVGIHTGRAVVGNVGTAIRMDYTAIGSTVSLASRIEGLTKEFAMDIIITDETWRQLDGMLETKPLGPVEIRGIPEPVVVHQVVGVKTDEESIDGDSSA